MSDAAFATELYQGALGRTPDQGSLSAALGALSRGVSRAAMALGIAESPEAQLFLGGQNEGGARCAA